MTTDVPVRWGRTTAWLVLLTAATAWLVAPSTPLPSPPASASAEVWSGWLADTPPVTSLVALVRAIAAATAVWLLLVTLLAAVAQATHAARALHLLDRCSFGVVRRLLLPAGLVLAVLPAGPAGASTTSASGGATWPSAGLTELAEPVTDAPDDLAAVLAPAGIAADDDGWALIVPVVDVHVEPPAPPALASAPPPVAPAVAPTTAAEPAPGRWLVVPGDHLWSIAERTLADAWGRAPSDREVTPYWRATVAANRDRLIDPSNPDLIFPGQELVVPTPPAA